MRALAHPVRMALIETLGVYGPMTATEVGERIDETPTTCSFHLRQLAKYGFVEEAGGGKGRARPWRLVTLGFSIAATHDDPETDIAANVLSRAATERQLGRYQNWMNTRSSYSREWRDAADNSEYIYYLTAQELRQLHEEMHQLLVRWLDMARFTDPARRPAGAVPVELLTFSYPVEPPKPASPSQSSPSQSSPSEPGPGEPSADEPDDAEEDPR